MPSRLWLLLAVPLLLRLLKRRPGPSREQLVPPKHEHVLLLGASSGIGRDLAHAYARRGAFICLVARRKEALDKVKEECVGHGLEPSRVLVVPANITSTEDLLNVRAAVEKGERAI
jgi:short-subunit dehydrogenase